MTTSHSLKTTTAPTIEQPLLPHLLRSEKPLEGGEGAVEHTTLKRIRKRERKREKAAAC
jgi:hypothetical protein